MKLRLRPRHRWPAKAAGHSLEDEGLLAFNLLEQRLHFLDRDHPIGFDLAVLDLPDQRRASDITVGVELDRAGLRRST